MASDGSAEQRVVGLPGQGGISPNISIGAQDKNSIVQIVFRVDPNILEWAVKTMADSHVEMDKNGGAHIVPNTDVFRCPYIKYGAEGKVEWECGRVKMRSPMLPPQAYLICVGDGKDKTHPATSTEPQGHHPILTTLGQEYLIGSLEGFLNTNFSSANFASSDSDVTNKLSLDMRLRLMGWADGVETLAAIIGNPSYTTQETKDRLIEVFTTPFMTKFITTLGWNIYSNASKGKGASAVNTVATNRVAVEATANTAMSYAYPDSVGAAQKKGLMSQLLSSLGFNKD